MTAERQLHILIVDASPVERVLYETFLEKIEGANFHFSEAILGIEGLAFAKANRPDCILLAYELPDMTGLRFLREITDGDEHSPIPVIVIAESGNEVVAVEVIRNGAADYIPKTIASTASLERAVKNAIEKHDMRLAIEDYRRNVEKANRDLRQRNEEIGKFYHTLSHEIKTPLTSAREFVAILLDGLGGEITAEQREYLTYAKESCDQMTRCLNDILDVARIETGKPTVHPEPCNIEELVTRVVGSLGPKSETERIDLSCSVSPGMPNVLVDEGRIIQVLTNLLTNAFKFTPQGGKVSVGVFEEDDNESFVRVSVRDTGRGIPEEQLSRIFDRLYQVEDEDSTFHTGMGLGLHISQEFVRMHGGQMRVESAVDEGSTFSFTIPKVLESGIIPTQSREYSR
jgi:two-component system, sensor histidine kinase and response regulator